MPLYLILNFGPYSRLSDILILILEQVCNFCLEERQRTVLFTCKVTLIEKLLRQSSKRFRSHVSSTASPHRSYWTSSAPVPSAVSPPRWLSVLRSRANGHILTISLSTACTHRALTEANWLCWCQFSFRVVMMCCQDLSAVLTNSPLRHHSSCGGTFSSSINKKTQPQRNNTQSQTSHWSTKKVDHKQDQ